MMTARRSSFARPSACCSAGPMTPAASALAASSSGVLPLDALVDAFDRDGGMQRLLELRDGLVGIRRHVNAVGEALPHLRGLE